MKMKLTVAMRFCIVLSVSVLFVLQSCSLRIKRIITKSYGSLNTYDIVDVYNNDDLLPADNEELGSITIIQDELFPDYKYEELLEIAKREARQIGGNALKIKEYNCPSLYPYDQFINKQNITNITPIVNFGKASKHYIKAIIYRLGDISLLSENIPVDSSLINADYAVLHVFRPKKSGLLPVYGVHLGDSLLCHVTRGSSHAIKTHCTGTYMVWARTESRTELPINIQKGKEYYIQCGVKCGIILGHPTLTLINPDMGKKILAAQAIRKIACSDTLSMNDGRVISCKITDEDTDYIYFSATVNDNTIDSKLPKSKIKQIKKCHQASDDFVH